MSVPSPQNVVPSQQLTNSLLQMNRLLYKMPPSLSVASQRHYIDVYPQQRTYGAGDTLVVNMQTGSQFIDARRSYLKLRVTTTAASTGDFGSGSVANVFKNIRVKSQSGVEICRLQGANLWSNVWQRWNCSRNAFSTTLHAQGYGTAITGNTDGTGTDLNAGADFIFPLYLIPCFNQSKLIPPQLMEGLQIEIELSSVGEAIFSSAGVAPVSYDISQLQFRLDAYDLADAFERKVNQMASEQGLNLVHKEYYRTLVSQATETYNYDIKKSASKALGIYLAPRLTANLGLVTADSVECDANDINQWQFQVGNTYFPNAPMVIGSANTNQRSAEAFYYTLAAWHRTDCRADADVNLSNYSGDGAPATGEAQMGIAATSLNKSMVSDIAGVMVNNSRSAIIELIFNTQESKRVDSYLCYLRHVKVFVQNAVVSD